MVYAVGLMSGTSLDGIDAALVDISGKDKETQVTLISFLTYPLTAALLQRIRDCLSPDQSTVAKICSLNVELGEVFAKAALAVCEQAAVPPTELAFIGSHGQTLFHIPETQGSLVASTLQVGDAATICERTQTTVVANFRERDMAVGGQGAPIVPYSEYLLYHSPKVTRILQNIGGIGNLTVIPRDLDEAEIIAFDTGPGNMIMNELCLSFFGEDYDKDGQHAAKGTVQPELLAELMAHPYIEKPFPKTTGREVFGKDFSQQLQDTWSEIAPDDFLATVTMFTASSIAKAVGPLIQGPTELIIGGGGSYNPTLVAMIKASLPELVVKIQEELGYSSEAKEAIAMAILANQTLQQGNGNVPSATGAKKAVPLGSITYY